MNFLYPGFLFALLAIAIPIAIHLFNFRKFKKIYFSNVQFLTAVKEQNSSREKLKHLLVLFSRILAIAFLVLAFARPFIPASGIDNHSSNRNLISIYIDNSYSMESLNKEGNLLEETKRKAKGIARAYAMTDQFKLVTNDFEGKHQRAVNREEFVRLLDDVKISASGRSLQQVVSRLETDLSTNVNEVAYLLSDFQKGFVGTQPVKTNTALNYSFVKLNANSLPNISIDSIWSLSPVHLPNQSEQFVVQLHNYGDEDAADIQVKLTINKQQKAISNVSIPAGKILKDTLSFSGLNGGWKQGTLAIKDFPLTFDDNLNFTFKVQPDLKVLNISGNLSERYIRSLFSADAYFKLTEMPESNIRYSAFPEYSLIVLDGLKEPSSGLAQQLKLYVENGGTLVVFPNLDANTSLYSSFLNGLSLPAVQELITGSSIASTIDLKNSVFKDVFEQVPENIDLPVVSRYFSYAEQNKSNKENILKLPLNRFLFAGYNIAAGKVYLSASSLDAKDGNIARHPVFVPLMFKVAFASNKEQPFYYITGRNNVLESSKINLSGNQSLKLVSDGFEVIPEVRQTPGKTLLYVADQVKKSGFYQLKKADSVLSVVAFNDDRSESDMHYATENEIKALLNKDNIGFYDAKKDALSMGIALKNNSNELWKLCLILAVVFLAVEILLIRFFNNSKNIQTT
jgi:hypothetical protein